MPLDHKPSQLSAHPGLDGIVATETVLSMVDGEAGVLVIRGHRLEDIAGRKTLNGSSASYGKAWCSAISMNAPSSAIWGRHASRPTIT